MASTATLKMLILGEDRGAQDALKKTGMAARKAGDEADSAGKGLSGFGEKVKGFAVGAAAAFGGLALGDLFMQSLDFTAGNAKLQAQLGLTKAQSATTGKVAGSLFSQNYGDSMAQVQEAIGSVVQNIDGMRSASKATLQDVSMRALNTANIFGQDLGGVTRAVSQMMRTGLAKNAKEAFDVITSGFQHGADKSGDFLDTLNEYGTQFRKLGIDGKTATGLISQGLKAGARDSDLVADAIKEFSIRAVDGSKTTAVGFKDIGLNAQKMSEQIAKGGPAARAGLDVVLDRLRKMKDPVAQSQAAVALFGTQAEDLGKALYALDPSKAVAGLGKVAGSADRANKALNDTPTAKMQTFFRQLQGGAIQVLGGQVIPRLMDLGKWIQKNADWLKPLAAIIGTVVVAWQIYTKAMALANAVMAANPIGLVIVLIAALVVSLIGLYKSSAKFREIVGGAFHAVATAASFMWNNVIKPVFKFLVNAWLDVAGVIIHGAAMAFGWVPGIGGKLKSAARHFDDFRDHVNRALNGIHDQSVTVHAHSEQAIAAIQRVKRELWSIPRSVRTDYYVNQVNSINKRASGQLLPGHATGTAYWRGGLTRVGENGPEVVNLPSGSAIYSNSRSQQMTGPGQQGGTVINLTINGALDPVAVGRQIDTVLTKYKKLNGRKPLTFEVV